MLERLRQWWTTRRGTDSVHAHRQPLTPEEVAERKRVLEQRYERMKRSDDEK